MPVLALLRARLARERALEGARIAVVFHVTTEVANLVLTLREAGAALRVVPSKVETVEGPALEALRAAGVDIEAPVDDESRRASLARVLAFRPNLVIDNADLFALWHDVRDPPPLMGATLHSRSACLKAEERAARIERILFPTIMVGSSAVKLELESLFGTGQSVVDSILRVTGLQLSGKRLAIIGYGNVGSGIARFARGLNARVVIAQNSPLRALKAIMDGYDVSSVLGMVADADVIVSATGAKGVLTEQHFRRMRDGVFLGNVGNSRDEIDIPALARIAQHIQRIDHNLTEYRVDGKRIYLMGDGHQFNHVCGIANSSEMMDLSLALHVLAMEQLWTKRGPAANGLLPVPRSIENEVALLKLQQLGIDLEDGP
jgi:adenosylhomocysteinase